MSDYLTNFFKSEDSAGYAKRANSGMMLGYPVSIGGESRNPENGIGYHSTIKVFNRDNDHGHLVHHMASNLPLNPPDPKTTHIEPSEFKARDGSTVYVIKLHGRSSDKIKEHHGKFAGMGDPENYEFQPHISVSKELHDKIKTSGAKTAHEAKIEFGNAELKRGPQTIKTYHHKPDSAEPAVPDEGDMTAKIPYEPQMGKLAASEKDLLCPIHKAENNNLKPLMKPYVSDAQRRWAHTPTGTKALGGEAGVHEWDEATKGKKLPERVAKSEMIPSPSKDTHKELTLHHGTKSPSDFEHFDMKHHASGFYPGIYTSSNPEDVKKHGRPIKVGFKGHLFEIKDPKHADQLHRHVGGGGSGHPLVQKLKAAGYHGIKRGSEHIIFDPEHAKIQKSELALSKSEIPLEKGSLQSRTKFNPSGSLSGQHQETMSAWQGAPNAERVENREKLPGIEGNARERALHKLSGQTQTKLVGNKRYFLLHRGMSPEEHSSSVSNGMVNHPSQHSSWTPRHNLANNFANPYSKTPGKLVSAWVHEDNIHTVPKQFGAVDREYAASSGQKSNRMANEHEVIVRPNHSSKIENEKVAERPTSRSGDRIHDIPINVNDAINIKGAKEQKARTHSAHPDDIKSMIEQSNRDTMRDQIRHRKLGKSEQAPTAPSPIKINPEHGKTIASAYDQMKHDPHHPDVKAAYGALASETGKQFKDIMGSGLKISKIKPGQANPYKSSKDMHNDIQHNKHLWYFPTDQGFGDTGQTQDHPMLGHSGFHHEGQPLLHNDVFRIVHDINGHHAGGQVGFGPKGEHQAYLQHKKMYSPLANKALFTETAGQNAWVNFGPHGEHNKANPSQTKYAEQKAGLMPEHIINGKWHNET